MAIERTLSIIKPDAVAKNVIGKIYQRFEEAGLKIVAARMLHLSRAEAEGFYAVHRERPFFGELVAFITRSPLVAMVVEGGPDTWKVVRGLMGATNPREAAPGTIRGDLALETGENLVHGSDAPESAEREIGLFFPALAG